MITCLRILQILSGFFVMLLGMLLWCMCELTYTQTPSDMDAPKFFAVILILSGLILLSVKELKK